MARALSDDGLSKSMDKILIYGWITILCATTKGSAMLCYCTLKSCELYNNTCVLPPASHCFLSVQLSPDHTVETVDYGCMPAEESATMQCKANLLDHSINNPRGVECCNNEDLCNLHLEVTAKFVTTTPPLYTDTGGLVPVHVNVLLQIVLVITVTVCVAVIIIVIACLYFRYKKKESMRQKHLDEHEGFLDTTESLRRLMNSSTGSGSGVPLLVQRTIAKQISLVQSVGKGRYGEVWFAKWRGESVAVKIFFTREEQSWFRETELFQTVLLRHDNILGFIAADIKGTGSWTQLFLITDYHQHGSLHDYLRTNVLDPVETLTLAYSTMCGLNHLHTEVVGTKGKPAIAHRDIKTKNILVKNNGQCCIADLGLAIKESSAMLADDSVTLRQGTKRYMAPEILDGSLMIHYFDSYRRADMYAFGLVLWEICLRCVVRGGALEYAVPYHEWVSNDPSFDEMRRVVSDNRQRPGIPLLWTSDEMMVSLISIMTECWSPNPSIRMTSLRVKKTLSTLLDKQDNCAKS